MFLFVVTALLAIIIALAWAGAEVHHTVQVLATEHHRLRHDLVRVNIDIVHLSQDVVQQGHHHRMAIQPLAGNVRQILALVSHDIRLAD